MSLWSLILDGADLQDFDVERDRLLAQAPPEEHDRIRAEVQQAHQVHTELRDGRRRTAELTVLNHLSQRLTAIREPEALLAEVAVQARQLLAVDVAYIMLLEGPDILRIRVVDGAIGSLLRSIALPRGVGIGGRVLDTGQPEWTSDYVGEPALTHDPAVDRIAASEQLSSILGVPLRNDQDTMGVLLVAAHHRRPFTDYDVQSLTALAAPAAIAIRNAEIFDRLDESNARLLREHAASEAAARLHDRLMEQVLTDGGVEPLTDILGEELGGQVRFVRAEDGALPRGSERPESFGVRAPTSGSGPARWSARIPVRAGSMHLGVLTLDHEDEISELMLRQLERGATAAALALTAERVALEAERRSRGEVLAALFDHSVDDVVGRRRARAAGLEPQSIRSLAITADASRPGHLLLERTASATGGWVGSHDSRVVLLSPLRPVALREQLSTDREESATIVISGCSGPAGLREAYTTARQSLRLLAALRRSGGCVLADDLGAYRAVLSHAAARDVDQFVGSQLGPLQQRDGRRRSELVSTLRVFLDQAQHHARTAEQLGIHPNTLYQRLDRITALLGPQWRSPDRAFELHLALRIEDLRRI